MRRRWEQLEWIDKFGAVVITSFVVTIAALVLVVVLNGCDSLDPAGPTLPSLSPTPFTMPSTTMLATTVAPIPCGPQIPIDRCQLSNITVPRVTPPPTPAWDNSAAVPTIIVAVAPEAPQRPPERRVAPAPPPPPVVAPTDTEGPPTATPPPVPDTEAPAPPPTAAPPELTQPFRPGTDAPATPVPPPPGTGQEG